MSITKRILKDGSRVYELRYPSGNNPATGKPLPPYTERYKPPATWSDAKAEREARRAEADFIARCKAGQVLTKAEQRQRRKEQAEAAERERREAAAKPTFQSYGEKWLKTAARAGEKAPGTINNYRIMLDRVNPVLGSYRLEELTRSIMREYVEQLFTEGRDERTGEPLAYATKNRLFQHLSVFLNCAVEDGFIEVSPMLGVKKPKRPKSEQPTERKAFTAEEVQQIRAALDREPLMWKALVIFMLDSGCRRGEAVALQWDSVDFKTGQVTISRNAQYTAGKGCYVTAPKNGKTRSFYLNPQALSVMREWRQQQALFLMGNGLSRSGYCFTREDGQMLNPQTVTGYFTRFGRKYNISGFHPHALRHTMATLSIANGADIVSVSAKLGHSSPDITLNVYSHANEEAQRKANDLLAQQIYREA